MDGFVTTGLSIEDLVTLVATVYTMDSGPMPTLTGPQPDTGGHVSGASSPASNGPYNQNVGTLPDATIKDCRTAPCPKPAGPASSPTVEPDRSSSIHEVVPVFGLAATLSSFMSRSGCGRWLCCLVLHMGREAGDRTGPGESDDGREGESGIRGDVTVLSLVAVLASPIETPRPNRSDESTEELRDRGAKPP